MDLTKQIMESRHEEYEWKTSEARELARALISMHESFVSRNRQEYFRGLMLTIGQVFLEDNPTIQRLMLRPNSEKPKKTMDTSRVMRGRIFDPKDEQKKPDYTHKVRAVKMSEVLNTMQYDRAWLEQNCPTITALRRFAKKKGIKLNPALKNVEKAMDIILEKLESAEANAV